MEQIKALWEKILAAFKANPVDLSIMGVGVLLLVLSFFAFYTFFPYVAVAVAGYFGITRVVKYFKSKSPSA